jgi:transposase, IS30 family
VAQRQEYAELRARGVSNAEACRIVGINRRTGTRWLYGRSVPCPTGGEVHYPPVINHQKTERSERYLSEDEREFIAERLRVGESLGAIGRELGRAPSTISREVARNGDEAGVYRPAAATAPRHRPAPPPSRAASGHRLGSA